MEKKSKVRVRLPKVEAVPLFSFFILHSTFPALGVFLSSWQEHREECGLNGFYVLEGIAAGGAVINHAAARRAERTVQTRVLRVAERAGDCFVAGQLELNNFAPRYGDTMRPKPLPACGRDAIGPPGRIENVLDLDFVDFRHSADGLDDLLVDHLQRRATSEGRRDENAGLTALNFDALDDAQVNDADGHLRIVDLSQDRPDVLLDLGMECRLLHDTIIASVDGGGTCRPILGHGDRRSYALRRPTSDLCHHQLQSIPQLALSSLPSQTPSPQQVGSID